MPSTGRFFPWLLRRPVSALMAFLLIVVLGVVAYRRIPITLMPQGLGEPEMEVSASYSNASPQEVFEHVVKPLEDELRAMPGVVKLSSTSSAGRGRVSLEFNPHVDMNVAYAEVRDRIERVRATFPEGVDKPSIWRWNSDLEMPIFWLGILFDPDVEDPFGTVEDVVQKRLEAVDGVAQVTIDGMVEESVRILVRPEALRAHGLSLYEVVAQMRRDNFALPAGEIAEGEREFLLRIDTSLKSIDEIREYPVRGSVKLKDVADVDIRRAYRDSISRVNGKRSLTATVSKESGQNTVDTCKRVLAQLDQLRADERLKGFEFTVYFNQATLIEGALDDLKSSLAWGALFSVLVLYVFVRQLGMTLLVAFAIPVSLLAALVAMYFCGFTFNLISLAGFTLVVGMLVDDSVVVSENILRLRQLGKSARESATFGAAQVSLAIVLSTLTTIVVFTPMVFMAEGKSTRALLTELAAPISFSLLASLVVALVFLPLMLIGLARFERREPRGADTLHGSLLVGYRRALSAALGHRFATGVVLVLLLFLGQYAFSHTEVSFEQMREGGGRLRLSVELPKRFTLEEASDVFAQYEQFLVARRDEYKVRDVSTRFNRQSGRIFLWFKDGAPRNYERDLSKRLKDEMPRIPGVALKFGFEQGGENEGSIKIQLSGRDNKMLADVAEDVVRVLERIEELSDVKTDLGDANEELLIQIDREKAQRFGVAQESLQGLIAWGVGGQQLAGYKGGAREIPMIIEYEEPEEGDISYLRSLDVPVSRSGSVPLSALTKFGFERSSGSIRRTNGVVSLTVVAQSFDKNSYRIQRKVADALNAFPWPEGYTWRDRGNREDYEQSENEAFMGLWVGCVFVFLLMGMLFESTILPLAVLLAIPLALVGGSLALWISHTPVDGTALLGFILLAGVVVKNGIVQVDRIQQLRMDGLPRFEAVVEGCTQRLRPVIMTALTTIFGLLPMALPKLFAAHQGSGMNYQSLAVATLGGMTLSTALTLFVVPVFYTLFDDLGLLLRSMFAPRARSDDPSPAVALPPHPPLGDAG